MLKREGNTKGRGNNTFIISAIVFVIFIGIFMITTDTKRNEEYSIDIPIATSYYAEDLFEYKSEYIGDAGNISNLLNRLPLHDFKEGISLVTVDKPYGLTVNYNFSSSNMDIAEIEAIFHKNALVVFTLIKNVDDITFNMEDMKQEYSVSREAVQREFSHTLWEYSKDIETFRDFVNTFDVKPMNIEEAVNLAVKARAQVYFAGEVATAGQSILGMEEVEDQVKVYTLTSVGWFGFENGIFTKVSGSGAIIEERSYKIQGSEPKLID